MGPKNPLIMLGQKKKHKAYEKGKKENIVK